MALFAVGATAASVAQGGLGIYGYNKIKKANNKNYYNGISNLKKQFASTKKRYEVNRGLKKIQNEYDVAELEFAVGTGAGFSSADSVTRTYKAFQMQQGFIDIDAIDEDWKMTELSFNQEMANVESNYKAGKLNNQLNLIGSLLGVGGNVASGINSIRDSRKMDNFYQKLESGYSRNNNITGVNTRRK